MDTKTFFEHCEQDTPNVLQVKALYKAFRENDRTTIAKLLVDDPVWNVSPGFPDGGVYRGMDEIFGSFYSNLRSRYPNFSATPDAFFDGGAVVTVLGYYKFKKSEEDLFGFVRFAHIWGINSDGRIKGVWQVADSAQFNTRDKVDA